MADYFKRVSAQTATRFWINNVTVREADVAIDAGAVGCTQNPSYTWKILNGSEDAPYAEKRLEEIMKTEKDDEMALVNLQLDLVARVAERFIPIYKESKGKLGYVSIQGSPIHEDVDTIVKCARVNHAKAPNIMCKIPVTEEGLKAIDILVREGVPINATECMAVKQVIDVCEVYVNAIKDMENPAPLFFSLITGIYDEYLGKYVKEHNIDVNPDSLWQAGMSIAKKVDQIVRERRYPCGFIGGGARGLHHFTEMVGCNANITINWKGTADKLIEQDAPVVSRFLAPTPFSVEDELLEKLEPQRKAYFINGIKPEEYEDFGPVVLFRSNFTSAWEKALALIASKR